MVIGQCCFVEMHCMGSASVLVGVHSTAILELMHFKC